MFSTLSLKQLEFELQHGVTTSPVFHDHDVSPEDIESPSQKHSTDGEPPHLGKSHDPPNVEPRQPSCSRRKSDDSGDVMPAQSSDNRHGSNDVSDIDPLQSPEPRPTRHESASVQPPPTSKHPRTTDDSSPPRSSKRGRRSGPRPAWNAREDELVHNCVARGGTLIMAIAELQEERCGPPRSYEACKARWYRSIKIQTNKRPEDHEHDSDYPPEAVLPQANPPRSYGRRGNFTRVWRPREDDVLMLRYADADTDWEAVAAEINRLGCVLTPRTPASCKARWTRRFQVHYDDSEEEDNDMQPDDPEQHADKAQHRNRGQSVPSELHRTLTTLGDNPVPLPAATLTTGGPEEEQIEPCIVLRNPNDPGGNDERTFPVLAERTLHSQTETSGPEPHSRPPTRGPDSDTRPPTSQPDMNATSRNPNTQSVPRPPNELPQQDDAPRHAAQSPPRLELSADYQRPTATGLPEGQVDETEATQSGLLSMAELADNENSRPRGPGQRPPVNGLRADGPKHIDPIFLEKAANEIDAMTPYTCILVCRAVARNVQRILGAAAGSEAELMDEIAKDLEEGWHRSTVIAVRYKTLTGDDIEPELVETALRDIEAVQDGTSDKWLHFCVWVLQANLSSELAEGEKSMEDIEKLEMRETEARAGKDKWRCVVARYRQLCRGRR